MKTLYIYITVMGIILIPLHGCKKLVQSDLPIDKYTPETVFRDKQSAALAITDIYAYLSISGAQSISVNSGLMADELSMSPGGVGDFNIYTNNFTNGISWNSEIWDGSYRIYIFRINSILDGLYKSKELSPKHKQLLIGEAKFLRAFIYFYLVNFFGDVPLVLTTDFKINSNIARTSKDIIYEQIIEDLKQAREYLSDNYLSIDLDNPTPERVRPNKFSANALLARVYLYTENWQLAEEESTKLIDNSNYELLPLNNIFLKNSKEAIWQIQSNPTDLSGNTNSFDAMKYFKPSFDLPTSISSVLQEAFEAGDKRKENWIGNFEQYGLSFIVPNKYKIGGRRDGEPVQQSLEYNMVLRLAEQYLIRSEARARNGNFYGSIEDLNQIRRRAGLNAFDHTDNLELVLTAIDHERFVELFTEWGDRWLNLKRRKTINKVMEVVAPNKKIYDATGSWSAFKALLPIPLGEFKNNPALRGHQNPGYTEN